MTFSIITLGCKVNSCESAAIHAAFLAAGYSPAEEDSHADVYIINSCAVTGVGVKKARQTVSHCKTLNPDGITVLCGCYPQAYPEEAVRDVSTADIITGNANKSEIPAMVSKFIAEHRRMSCVQPLTREFDEASSAADLDRTRAFIKIEDGCDRFCTYCIIPTARGRVRSRRPEDILSEVRELARAGYKDITLLGQNVNSYGKDLPEDVDFAWLLREVNAVPGDFLIRFMTSHPKDASERLFDAMAACEKVAPHLHLPFQAGNDRVLRAMNRGYTREHYLGLIRALRARIPDIVLTSDIIVGFPGETTEEFEDTLKVLKEVRFDALFTFIYSPREGTPAARLPDPLSREEKAANFQRLVELQNAISAEKQAAYVGKTLRCLVDVVSEDPRHNLNARTAGGRLVHFSGDPALLGSYVRLKITGASTWALFGEPAD